MVVEKPTKSRDDLRRTAVYQKGIIFCLLAYILEVLLLVVYRFALPPALRLSPAVRLFLALLGLGGIFLLITAAVFVFLLATKVYGTGLGVLLAILTLIPWVGLIVLLIINAKATGVLKRHGIRVGLLGAYMSDIK